MKCAKIKTMKNWLIKKIGGKTLQEFEEGINKGIIIGTKETLNKLKSCIVSVRSDVENSGQRLYFMAGFIDYICVKMEIPKIYNNGSYEKFIEEL